MLKGTIIDVRKGGPYTVLGDDENIYKFNKKSIVDGDPKAIRRGRRVEFEPKGEGRASNVRILEEMGEVPNSVAKKPKMKARPQTSTAQPQLSGQYRFLNPYNFVRYIDKERPKNHVLGNCPPPPHDRYVGLTGRIKCKIEAVTPLFVSDSHAVHEDPNGHRTYRFFQVEEKGKLRRAIPATSLRGMVRSVFEAVTNSCFVVFQEDEYPLEHREPRIPSGMVPARVIQKDRDGAVIEILDATQGIPFSISTPPPLMPAAYILAYEPRVLDKNGKTYSHERLPKWVRDRVKKEQIPIRVAALIKEQPRRHRSGRFQFFEVVRVVPIEDESELRSIEGQTRKVYGWLYITGPNIENKHHERLFFRWDDTSPEPSQDIPKSVRKRVSKKAVDEFEHHLKEYYNRAQRALKALDNQRWPASKRNLPQPSLFVKKNARLKEGQLVYAIIEGNEVTRLRPVSIPRLRYEHTRQELLPDHLKRCDSPDELCPACRTFGWVWDHPPKDAKRVAYAGRIRFSHASLVKNAGELPEITLAILSTPKPTTTFFYLLDEEGNPNPEVDYDNGRAKLRGRKFYRHHGSRLAEQEFRRETPSDQNRTVRGALKAGSIFTFTVDFDNLAPLELGALLYALELEEGMFHRLGYAKPLGFGSIRVTVEKVEIIDWEARLQSLEPNAGWKSLEGRPLKNAFLREMRKLYGDLFDEVLEDLRALLSEPPALPIHYPRSTREPTEEGENFTWFVGNRKRIDRQKKQKRKEKQKKRGPQKTRKETPPEPPVALPLANEDVIGLPLIDRNGKEVTD